MYVNFSGEGPADTLLACNATSSDVSSLDKLVTTDIEDDLSLGAEGMCN